MADIAVQTIVNTGLNASFTAAASGGDTFDNDGRTYFHVKNGGAGASVVTMDSVQACNQGFDHNGGGSVPAGGERIFGPFATNRFNSSAGKVAVSYDVVTSVTVAAIKLPSTL